MDFEKELSAFQSEMNARLDYLDVKISTMADMSAAVGPADQGTVGAALGSASSVGACDLPPPPEIDWDNFAELIKSNPEDAVMDIIYYIRTSLARKASTKRLIEKANCQYVDQSFQRVSTQLTALINQKVLQNHNQLESEINDVIGEVDKLRDYMAHEFGELRLLIEEIKQQKDELEREGDYPGPVYCDSHKTKANAIKRAEASGPLRRANPPLLRMRRTVHAASKPFAFTLNGIGLRE